MNVISRSNLLVLVPAWNEERSIGEVIHELVAHGFVPLVISDGSTDRTAEVARANGARVLELAINMGVGGALRAGFRTAVFEGYEAVVQVDADGQHPANDIEDLIIAANDSGAHFVLGSRFTSSGTSMSVGFVRRRVMRVLAGSATRATGVSITDATSGFRLIRGELLQSFSRYFPANYLGDTYEALVSAGRAGYRVIEVPAALRARTSGQSSASVFASIRFTFKGLAVAMLHLHQRIPRYKGLD
jgi:glycosyltransferase involved in cell wall biosynthesis